MVEAAEMFTPLTGEELVASLPADDRPNKVPIVPVPVGAPPMRFQHPVHGEPDGTWPYHDAQGRLVGYVCRWNLIDAEGKPDKDFLPVTFCDLGDGRTGWAAKGFPEPRPLYRLPNIAASPHARILIVEGEKAADAAARLFEALYLTSCGDGQRSSPDLVATTPPHGAKSPHKADWTPLKGRQVAVWPDHDDPGAKYAQAVARLAGATSVAIVDVPADFPVKWDLADVPPEGWTTERLRGLLDAARPFQTKETAKPKPDWPYRLRADGVHRLVEREDRQSGEKTTEWIRFCSHLGVTSETRDIDGQNWGRLGGISDRS